MVKVTGLENDLIAQLMIATMLFPLETSITTAFMKSPPYKVK